MSFSHARAALSAGALIVMIAIPARAQEAAGPPAGATAQALGLEVLTDDPSRAELFAQMRLEDAANDQTRSQTSQQFALTQRFRFPVDTRTDPSTGQPRVDSWFGVDISHHQNASFPIEQLRAKGARFLYMKASQGARYVDDKFASFWWRTGRLPKGAQVHRGAYHFLSATDPRNPNVDAAAWGRQQAATFIKVLEANRPWYDTDMPPVVDLEWDRAKPDAPDRWKDRKPEEILAMTKAFVEAVRAGAQRTPMIYTAQSWWHERIGQDARLAELADYPLWLADYTEKSRTPETPRSINGAKWTLWQFTEKAQMPAGYANGFDANIYKGKPADFYSRLNVKAFD